MINLQWDSFIFFEPAKILRTEVVRFLSICAWTVVFGLVAGTNAPRSPMVGMKAVEAVHGDFC